MKTAVGQHLPWKSHWKFFSPQNTFMEVWFHWLSHFLIIHATKSINRSVTPCRDRYQPEWSSKALNRTTAHFTCWRMWSQSYWWDNQLPALTKATESFASAAMDSLWGKTERHFCLKTTEYLAYGWALYSCCLIWTLQNLTKWGLSTTFSRWGRSWTKKGYNILFKFTELKSGNAGIQAEAL